MTFVKPETANLLKEKLVSDASLLGKLYKSKNSEFYTKSIDHSLLDDAIREGWVVDGQPLKTKTKIKREKSHHQKFEDAMWSLMYELGYRKLNFDNQFFLPYGKDPEERKQIDVIAIDDETAIIIECRSAETSKKGGSLKTEFEGLEMRLDGFRKSIRQLFGNHIKVKYIFATRNIRIESESEDIKRLLKSNSYYFNDNSFDYIKNLIKSYKKASKYQFLGLLFKDQLISTDRIVVPAVEGSMGGKKYYMFSLEPTTLLKMSFILHRTKANELELPTYQRLLVPSRLKGITKFIDKGGFFPNSIILNFNQKKQQIKFDGIARESGTNAKQGILSLPNAYAVAYLIDGQHRLYGYAQSTKLNNTIPVVAFVKLDAAEQLRMFMDINQNQKAVSATLKMTLEEDLFWDSDIAASRLKALRSAIVRELGTTSGGPLTGKVSIGEDKSILSATAVGNSLLQSGLLPGVRGNKFNEETTAFCLYNISNSDHTKEMLKAKKEIVNFINLCYDHVESNYNEFYLRVDRNYFLTNRGTSALINLIGSLNTHEVKKGVLSISSKPNERFTSIVKYLDTLVTELKKINKQEEERIFTSYGTGGDVKWLRFFQYVVHSKHEDYFPEELKSWNERQDQTLQDKAMKFAVNIERAIKEIVLRNLKILFGDNYDLEINSIKRECQKRAEEETEKRYKETGVRKNIQWTEMFMINDYKSIIKSYWTKAPEVSHEDFRTFHDIFSIKLSADKFNSQADRTKWLSYFNSHRNNLAHQGSKEKGLDKDEVTQLEIIHNHFKMLGYII